MASTVQGKVIEHGSAPYKRDPDNSQSYFVQLEGDNGETRELWGMGIRDAIQAKGIQKNDDVAFYDQGLAEGKRNWDVERIERLRSYPNSIENDLSKDKEANNQASRPISRERYKNEDEELEFDLPSSVKNNYVFKVANRFLETQKVNFYDRNSNDGSIAFEDRAKSLHTSKEDEKTIKAMLDVAQAKNWSAIKVKGTEAFKREAWLEASIRGIEVKGFKPQEKDLIELQKRQAERNTNQVLGNETRSRELNSKREEQSKLYTKEEDKSIRDHAKDAGTAVAIDAGLAVATGGKYSASMVATSIIADKAQSLAFDKLDEKYKLSEKISEINTDKSKQSAEKQIEQEALIRSNEFDAGRDVDYSGGSEVEAEVEDFHNNLAVPTGIKGMSKAEATQQVEASFDRKVNTTQRNQVIEDKEAQLSSKDWLAIQAYRKAIDYRFKDDPVKRQEKHDALNEKIPDIVAGNGKFELEPPTITQQPEVEVSTREMGSQDRGR